MRRALAIFLLAVISSPLVAPLLQADTASDLPACCRRDGKHHCAMASMADEASSATPAFTQFHPKCPLFPRVGVLPADSKTGLAAATLSLAAMDAVQQYVVYAPGILPRIAPRVPDQKRGPPPVLPSRMI